MASRCIYILDNDPTAALVTQRGLQTKLDEHTRVVVAENTNTAWLACARGAVDLIIIDPGMYNSAAYSLVRVIRTYRPSMPLIVLTAYDSPGLRSQMRELGIQYYLAKPIDLRELLRVVFEIMSRSSSDAPAPDMHTLQLKFSSL